MSSMWLEGPDRHLQADVERSRIVGHEEGALDLGLALAGLAVIFACRGRPRAQHARRARRLLRRRHLHLRQVLKERLPRICEHSPMSELRQAPMSEPLSLANNMCARLK
jgi:hypothetical protein